MAREADGISSREGDRVYADLRARILTLDLAPGSVLDEAGIVQDTGVSRTPVREAVIRLVSEGLLRRTGRQIVVPAFEMSQIRAFFEALQLLTRATHRMAAERRDEAQLDAIRVACRVFEAEAARGDTLRMNDANHDLHLAIARASDSPFLGDAYAAVLVQSLRLSRQCFMSGLDPDCTRGEHVDLILNDHAALCDAIERRAPDDADRIASAHCDLFRRRLSRQLLGPSRQATDIVMGFDGARA